MKKSLKNEDLKIIKDTPVSWIKFDVEMSLPLSRSLINYAEQNMKREDKESLLIEWAFVDILKKACNKK